MKAENRAGEAMKSLEGIQRAKAPEHTFAKIQQKLADQRKQQLPNEQHTGTHWLKVAAVIAFVICSNAWALTNYWPTENETSTEDASYAQLTTDFNLYENE
ncbi:hypothetical protein E1176_14350 [Fulvivirga sp. RKSG066]|uniref:hypothetical protein n=1 Tax=Fulvivirga aurantia TaxID=2529383 RepID=UPI001CA44379|nr:hypothetical protein [Fulvivirga aurantia]MTI22209.1 hypothetical protein [Fulvivirga aurantia]